MKNRTRNWRLMVALSAIISGCCPVVADVFLGPSSETNRFELSEKQIVLFHQVSPSGLVGQALQPILWITPVSTNGLSFGYETNVNISALSGPGRLSVHRNVAISYTILPTVNARSIFIPQLGVGESIRLEIPAKKSFRFFQPLGAEYGPVRLQRGDLVVSNYRLRGGDQLDGPLVMTFLPLPDLLTTFQPTYFATYLENDPSPVIPQALAIRAPAGVNGLQVQKSTDLKTWTPSVEIPVVDIVDQYYRIQVNRK